MRCVDYVGRRDQDGNAEIIVGDGPRPTCLDGRHDLNHFADRFGWGEHDILGGLQTAQAILADALQNDVLARLWPVEFWRYVVRNQPQHGFRFSRADVIQWVIDGLTAELTGEPFPDMKEGTNG